MTDSYAGIGSRKTPDAILKTFAEIGTAFEELGFILRSGGALGADTAFESGLNLEESKEIYLPWELFNQHPSDRWPATPEAHEIARHFHPAWERCNHVARAFHARNSHQVLGQNCNDPVNFVICWTFDGNGGGGTGQAIRIANHWNIPVIDFGKDPKQAWQDVNQFIDAYDMCNQLEKVE